MILVSRSLLLGLPSEGHIFSLLLNCVLLIFGLDASIFSGVLAVRCRYLTCFLLFVGLGGESGIVRGLFFTVYSLVKLVLGPIGCGVVGSVFQHIVAAFVSVLLLIYFIFYLIS